MNIYQKIKDVVETINEIKEVKKCISNGIHSIYTFDRCEYSIKYKKNKIDYKLYASEEINKMISDIMFEWFNQKMEENKKEIKEYIVKKLDEKLNELKEQCLSVFDN